MRADPPPATAPALKAKIVSLSLAPTAIAEPALQYSLLPDLVDQTPGDAAPLYLMAFMQPKIAGDGDKVYDMLDTPVEKFPVDAAQELLSKYKGNLALIELAARRDRCHWEPPFREQGLATLLPYLNSARFAVQLLSLQARVEMAQGRFREAVHTLQTGFALADHLKNDAVLVQGLVALGMAQILLVRVDEFIQTPGAPNLYWALAHLPRPLMDLRLITRIERTWLEYMLPELKHRGPGPLNAGELGSLIAGIKRAEGADPQRSVGLEEAIRDRLAFAGFLALSEAPARKWLGDHGYNEKQVHDMTIEQAVSAWVVETYRRTSDDLYKWSALPYWQARIGYAKSALERPKNSDNVFGNPLRELVPALSHVHRQIALTDRRIALLQATEALRAYAASHGGKLPGSLAELEESPVPVDPMTGKPFAYEVRGNTAVLRSAEPPAHAGEPAGIYEITLTGAH